MSDPDSMSLPLSPQASVAPLPASSRALDLPLAPCIPSSPDPHKPPPPAPAAAALQCKGPKAALTILTVPTHTPQLMTITLTNQTEITLVLNPTPLTRRPPPARRQLAAELFPEKTPAENVEEFMVWVLATFCSGDREVGCEGLASSIHANGQNQDQDQDQGRAGQKRSRPLDWERERENKRRVSRWEDACRGQAGGYGYQQQQQQQQEQYRRYTVAGQYGYMYGDGYYGYDRRRTNWGNRYNDGRQYDHYYGGGVSHDDGYRYHRRISDYGDRNRGHDHRHDHRSGANHKDTRHQANLQSETIDTNHNTNTTNIQPQEATATTFFTPAAGANTTVTQPQENHTTNPTAPIYLIPTAAAADTTSLRHIPTAQEENPTSRNVRTKISYRQRNAYKDHQYQQRHRSSNSTVPDLYPPVTTRSGAYARPEEYEASRGRVKEEEEE
ncbi:hypothetical protein P167DRAFT_263049 [Morchella conica CCBAS932]|uniref:Uncharacterized protein n=1 Tax=Morchella conica CCBAS932 TaxID=1392247 RepID=A0A3N4L495_9PEZI|nr:hypothetical protein P167DRAFT_263049 [Morchella conica CCBAS932]